MKPLKLVVLELTELPPALRKFMKDIGITPDFCGRFDSETYCYHCEDKKGGCEVDICKVIDDVVWVDITASPELDRKYQAISSFVHTKLA